MGKGLVISQGPAALSPPTVTRTVSQPLAQVTSPPVTRCLVRGVGGNPDPLTLTFILSVVRLVMSVLLATADSLYLKKNTFVTFLFPALLSFQPLLTRVNLHSNSEVAH